MVMLEVMASDGNLHRETVFGEMLAGLPASHREAVRLRHERGWKLEAIAAKLNKTPVEVAALLLEAAEIVDPQVVGDPPTSKTTLPADRENASLETQTPPHPEDTL